MNDCCFHKPLLLWKVVIPRVDMTARNRSRLSLFEKKETGLCQAISSILCKNTIKCCRSTSETWESCINTLIILELPIIHVIFHLTKLWILWGQMQKESKYSYLCKTCTCLFFSLSDATFHKGRLVIRNSFRRNCRRSTAGLCKLKSGRWRFNKRTFSIRQRLFSTSLYNNIVKFYHIHWIGIRRLSHCDHRFIPDFVRASHVVLFWYLLQAVPWIWT